MNAVSIADLRYLLLAAMVLALPLLGLPSVRRLRQHPSGRLRLRMYRRSLAMLWTTSALAFALLGTQILRVSHVGQAQWIFAGPFRLGIVATVAAAFVLVALLPGVACLLEPKRRSKYQRALESTRFMLPASPLEGRWFVAVSLTAGICEELMFRGFVISVLRDAGLSLTLAWLLSSLIFGLNHLYQGFSGILRSTFAGVGLGLIAILTGGLWVSMAVHAAANLQVLAMYRPEEGAVTC